MYFSVQRLVHPAHPLGVELACERNWPVVEWTEALYASDYLLVLLVPLLAPTRRALRLFTVTGLLATVLVGALWLVVPVVGTPRPFVPTTAWGRLLAWERSIDANVASFPSFHVLWALIAADTLRLRSRAWGVAGWSWAGLVTLSCATTGQHALLDLVAAAALFPPIRRHGELLSARSARGGLRPALRVHKWYLDCTSGAEQAAIAYVGRVSLGWLQIPYVELLSIASGRAERRRRLSRRARVRRDGSAIVLEAPALGVSGRWSASTASVEAVLLDGPGGTIRWRCHQPGGAAVLRLPGGEGLEGTGYAEELEMTCAPWALPFRELRWGRFLGGGRSVVWIDWRGGLERRWVFVDGAAVEPRSVETQRIEWMAGRLDIDPGRLIREAEIGRTVAGPLAFLLPRPLARATECKWLSRGRLQDEGPGTEGSVLHEVVRWA